MLVDVTIHHGGRVQQNPFQYIGRFEDFIKSYDVDFFSVWEVEDLVRDLGYINDLAYWYKMDDGDIEEPGKPLRNDTDVMDLLHVLEVENMRSVHIYVEHRIDEAVMIDQVYLLPPPDDPIANEMWEMGKTFLISMVMWGMGMTFPMERVMLDMKQPYLVIRKT
ncbi:hypothetical protein SLA2020_267810 [Shorea laevis]